MKKRIAIITDIHGNVEALKSILNDIEKNNVDDIICLGDTIGLGPNSKECIDLLISNNIKMILGNHELYLLKGPNIDSLIGTEEREYYKWVKDSLSKREVDYIKKCPLYLKYNDIISDKDIIFCHYLIKDEKSDFPFETDSLKNNVNLWIKYNNTNVIYFVGHLHNYFDPNEVEGISDDYIEDIMTLPNIYVVGSAGCSHDDMVAYTILDIDKSIQIKNIKVKFDREVFVNKLLSMEFPDKKNILKIFYGIDKDM